MFLITVNYFVILLQMVINFKHFFNRIIYFFTNKNKNQQTIVVDIEEQKDIQFLNKTTNNTQSQRKSFEMFSDDQGNITHQGNITDQGNIKDHCLSVEKKSSLYLDYERDFSVESSLYSAGSSINLNLKVEKEKLKKRTSGESVDLINSRNTLSESDIQIYDEITNVCICMIDIVGFSSWCSNHLPQIIAYAMINYNKVICEIINKYTSLKKIELVGDCCMIQSVVSNDSYQFGKVCKDMICFAKDILCELTKIKRIFKSQEIGLRIGIHLGDVIGLYINHPLKYQLFSNDINICSRLEASAITNTIHVSEKLLFVANHCNLTDDIVLTDLFRTSGKIRDEYKGVGFKCSYMLHLKKNAVLMMDFEYVENVKARLPNICIFTFDDTKVAFDNYNSYSYIFVCLDISKCQTDSDMDIMLFKWSSRKKCNVEIVLCSNMYQLNYLKSKRMLRFDGFYNMTDSKFKHKMRKVYDSFIVV